MAVHEGRRLIVLDEATCMRALHGGEVGRLGFSAAALPVVLPVNYAIRGRCLYFRTEPGMKLDAARAGVVACLEVDDFHEGHRSATSVLATGRMRLITDPDELERLSDLVLVPWGAPAAQHLVELTIELLSGRELSVP